MPNIPDKELDEILNRLYFNGRTDRTGGLQDNNVGTAKQAINAYTTKQQQALLDWVLAEVVEADEKFSERIPFLAEGNVHIQIRNDMKSTQRQIIEKKKGQL